MLIKPITGGMFESLSYIIAENGRGLLIDAGVNAEKVLAAAEGMKVSIEKIILTHGHIDHIIELDNLVKKTNAKVYIHIDDEPALTDASYNVSAYVGGSRTFESRCEILRDGSIVTLGDLKFKIIHTPGHTPGSICIEVNDSLFSGDTLFNSGYGRVDLPNGSFEEIYRSIVDKLFSLPGDMTVYPGHGIRTTIAAERLANPIRHAIEW